jgi:hypothetical protein
MPEGVSRRQTQDGGVEQRAESEGAAGRRLGGMQACEGLEDFGHDAHMRGRRAGCSTYLMSGAALI